MKDYIDRDELLKSLDLSSYTDLDMETVGLASYIINKIKEAPCVNYSGE